MYQRIPEFTPTRTETHPTCWRSNSGSHCPRHSQNSNPHRWDCWPAVSSAVRVVAAAAAVDGVDVVVVAAAGDVADRAD